MCSKISDACRLRISLSAAHTMEDVDALIAALTECGIHASAESGPVTCEGSGEKDAMGFSKL